MTFHGISIEGWIILGMVVFTLFGTLCKRLGWLKGAAIADDLASSLGQAKDIIDKVTDPAHPLVTLDTAAEKVAAHVTGVTAVDVKPIIKDLLDGGSAKVGNLGVNVTLTPEGNISVDPSGLVNKNLRKAGKWIKKIF